MQKVNFVARTAVCILLLFSSSVAIAQKAPEKNWSSSRILHELEKMKHVGRVLYIAAHPDDENTQLISYLANVKGVDIAYMSLTRGDGGQDLLGPEVREELGVMRTQELLMARSIDGGQQFFSRANDFGFSKTAKETLHIWDSTEVLSDIVWVIRKFKPDIIITRFSPTYKKTHGHHQASAILAQVAFDDAANPDKFPEQLKYVSIWQAKSLFWNTSFFFFQDKDNKLDTAGLYHTNIGVYMPLLGEWTGEMAAESRSMHKSQGMGSMPRRGDNMEYFVYMKGEKPTGRDIFSDYDWNWDRVGDNGYIMQSIDYAETQVSQNNSATSTLGALETLYHELSDYFDNYLVQSKIKQLQEIILQCEGVYTEAISTKKFLTPDDSINVDLSSVAAHGPISIQASLQIDGKEIAQTDTSVILNPDVNKTIRLKGIIPADVTITGPYWLEEQPTVGMYRVEDQLLRGLPQNPPKVSVHITYTIDKPKSAPSNIPSSHEPLVFEQDIPVFYKYTDPIKGETYSVARIVPPAVAIPDTKLLVFGNNKPQELHVKVKSFQKGKALLSCSVPHGWKLAINAADTSKRNHNISSLSESIGMNGEGQEQTFTFYVWPTGKAETNTINITIAVGKQTYNRSMEDINYEHIPEQILLPRSEVKVVKMGITTHPRLVGYIEGAGDDIPQMLREIGYKVEIIQPGQLATADLSKYDAIIAGVRAYNTVERLKYDNVRLMEYVKNGGNYIVQYNNNFRLVTDSIGPYFLHLSNIRTTDENCKVTLLNTDNPALNIPNKITENDFDGWVQERGLYYPDKWDTSHYVPLLEMNDPGELPVKGALLVAKYGEGNFVYTGLVFFRELPAGVPGAYRLLANLIELEKH